METKAHQTFGTNRNVGPELKVARQQFHVEQVTKPFFQSAKLFKAVTKYPNAGLVIFMPESQGYARIAAR